MFLALAVQASMGLSLAYLLWSLVTMEINYRRASSMGLPLVRLPVDPQNTPWVIIEPVFWRILDTLPIDWGTFRRYSRRGWQFNDKAESHLHYGPIWGVVTPRDVYLYVADPSAINDIFQRRENFLRPSKLYSLLEVYGPCISTASWTDWPRHRKVLAAPFNETVMDFVWKESLEQSRQMLQAWTSKREAVPPNVAKDTRTLSLNVLAAIGFRRSYSFQSSDQLETNETRTYRDALQTVLDNAILLMLVPPRYLLFPFVPRSWARIGKAAVEFKRYMIHMLDEETKLYNQGKMGSGTLMASFVRAHEIHRKEKDSDGCNKDKASKGLSVDEIFGNIFVINFAGHDTTANTLAFAMLLLAANPTIQDWIAEEICTVTGSNESSDWRYYDVYSMLVRCRAVMLETLRLYPPIIALPKWTNDQPQDLQIGNRTVKIPPRTGVMPSLLAIQTHPKYWNNPLLWDPMRWIRSPKSVAAQGRDSELNPGSGDEELLVPAYGTYFPWSDGPQNCPGAKFAQVEFVAVIASLFRRHRVQVVPNVGESPDMIRERTLATTEDCDLELLLRMRDASQVRLACEKRRED